MKPRLLSIMVVLFLAGCGDDKKEERVLVICPPGDTCLGKTYEQLTAEWWQWLTAIPAATSPNADGDCSQNQSGDVFFLGGNFGGSSVRSCTIPEGKGLFFPVLNVFYLSCPEVWGMADCDLTHDSNLLAGPTSLMEQGPPMAVTVEWDGEPIAIDDDYLRYSDVFNIQYTSAEPSVFFYSADSMEDGTPMEDTECLAPWESNNMCGVPAGPKKFATGGYWMFFESLPPGEHTLRFTGVVNPDDPYFDLDITFNLTVQ
jgi:hypothetical protein